MDSSGQVTELAKKILTAVAGGASPNEIAEKAGLPLYRVRSGVRELVEAGLVETRDETYALTEAGRTAMAAVSG